MIKFQRLCFSVTAGVLVLLCAGCGREPVEPLPTMENIKFQAVARQALPEPDSQGAQLVGRYCGQCHDIPDPTTHTADRWVPSVAEMVRYMQLHQGSMVKMKVGAPSSEEAARILAYLQAHAHPGLDMEAYEAALASEAGRDFRETCNRCHGLPDPRQHTAHRWPAVVRRMAGNMRSNGIQPPDEAAVERIVSFLQKYAAR